MNLDLRIPIGILFLSLGLLLVVFGIFTNGDAELYKRSLDININLWWGALLSVFGGAMLFFALRGAKKAK